MFYWVCKYILIGPWIRLLFRPQVEGLQHLPTEGAVILASNHLSFSDSVFLPLVCPRRVTFLAKSDYFTGKGIKGWGTRVFMSAVGMVPVDRSGGQASEAALNTGLAILGAGHVLGIYPEGTRSGDGRLYRGKTGVARMALEAGVPVIPCAMINTAEIQPPGKLCPKIMRVRIAIGEPIDFSRYEGMSGDRFVLRSMTDEIMYELMVLSGQEYVDVYAARAKAAPADAIAAAEPDMIIDPDYDLNRERARVTSAVGGRTDAAEVSAPGAGDRAEAMDTRDAKDAADPKDTQDPKDPGGAPDGTAGALAS